MGCLCQRFGKSGVPNHSGNCLVCGEPVDQAGAVPDAQPGLFELDAGDLAPIVEDGPGTGTHAERAARFHDRNPQVMRILIKLALYMQQRGLKHWGIGAAWEVLRFKALETTGEIYKLNNNHRAWYAREIMRTIPELQGFFEVRLTPTDPNYHDREVRS